MCLQIHQLLSRMLWRIGFWVTDLGKVCYSFLIVNIVSKNSWLTLCLRLSSRSWSWFFLSWCLYSSPESSSLHWVFMLFCDRRAIYKTGVWWQVLSGMVRGKYWWYTSAHQRWVIILISKSSCCSYALYHSIGIFWMARIWTGRTLSCTLLLVLILKSMFRLIVVLPFFHKNLRLVVQVAKLTLVCIHSIAVEPSCLIEIGVDIWVGCQLRAWGVSLQHRPRLWIISIWIHHGGFLLSGRKNSHILINQVVSTLIRSHGKEWLLLAWRLV